MKLQLPMEAILLLMIFGLFVVSSTGRDMSIIRYDATHMTTTDDQVNAMYESWLVKHGKFYNALGEKEKRFQIFKDNLRYIEHHNSGDHSYKLGLNKFADLTVEEFQSRYSSATIPNNRNYSNNYKKVNHHSLSADAVPDSVDWRTKGAVAPVKDQRECGDSSAFAVIGAVEGLNQIVTGKLVTLSEQQIVNCATGCKKGLMWMAFDFILDNGGVYTDKDYPYSGLDEDCTNITTGQVDMYSIDSYKDVPTLDYLDEPPFLQKAVANQPIASSFDVNSQSFMLYDSGILTGVCGNITTYSAVIVGYGSENGKDYWLMKNSMGTKWGEQGYIRLERNAPEIFGECNDIFVFGSYPIKKSYNPPYPLT